jgi:hypothetical protein
VILWIALLLDKSGEDLLSQSMADPLQRSQIGDFCLGANQNPGYEGPEIVDSILSRRAVAFYTKKPNSKDNRIDLLEQVLDNAKFDTK